MGYFRVPKTLTFKPWPREENYCENEFYLHDDKKIIFIPIALVCA